MDAINAYYDAEEERINNLEASEEELRDLRQDNNLARRQALAGIISEENQYTEIKREQAEELIDIEQETQDRITEIHREANRDREDVGRGFVRELRDIFRAAGVSETFFASGDFHDILGSTTDIESLAQLSDQAPLRRRLSELGISLGEDDFSRIRELSFDRLEDQEDINIGEVRDREDAERSAIEQAQAINLQAQQQLTALQQEIATIESETALMTSTTAETFAEIAEKQSNITEIASETAPVLSGAAGQLAEIAELEQLNQEAFLTSIENFGTLTTQFATHIESLGIGAERHIEAADRLNMSAESLINAANTLAGIFGRHVSRPQRDRAPSINPQLPDAAVIALRDQVVRLRDDGLSF